MPINVDDLDRIDDGLRGMPGTYTLIIRDGKMYVMPENRVTYDLVGNEVLGTKMEDSMWEETAALTIDIESKQVEKSRFF